MNQRYQSQGREHRHAGPTIDTSKINLKSVTPDLFDSVAKRTAETIANNTRSNKPTQLRKFYDEIVMWDTKVAMHSEKFDEYLPFIRMLNAKVAYAKGRNNLVDDNYAKLVGDCLKQVESPSTMRTFKLFMESFMGFYKQERPKD